MEFYVAPVMDYSSRPVIVSGRGCYVFDRDGKRYLDINCGQFSAVFGHSSEAVGEALARSQSTLAHLSTNLISESFLEAARALHERMPEMNGRILLLSTGSEAVECALRYAKHLSGDKPGVISFTEGYHGLTHGAEGYSMGRRWVKPSLPQGFSVDAPQALGDEDFDCAESVEAFRALALRHREAVAAAIFEPVVSVGGMLFPPAAYWREIRRICDEAGIYLIFDECQTGFGRTGSWFYYQQLGCAPDILVSAKAMGLGFPVSMVAFNGNTFPAERFSMGHFSSHQNDPFSAELVLRGIRAIEENRLLTRNRETGEYLVGRLEELSGQFPILQRPRGRGLLCGVSLRDFGFSKGELLKRQEVLEQIARENGALLQFSNDGRTMRILPAYVITEEEMDEFIRILGRSLLALEKAGYQVR